MLAIKLVPENRRIVFFSQGKPVRVAGPGFVVNYSCLQKAKLLDIASASRPFPDVVLPGMRKTAVKGNYQFVITDFLKAAGQADIAESTDNAVRIELANMLDNTSITDCLCGKADIQQITQSINRRTKSWGVKISELKISEFPEHKRMVRELMFLLEAPLAETLLLAERVAELEKEDVVLALKELETVAHGYKFGI